MVARDGTWRHVQVLLLRVAARVYSYIVRYSYHADILMYLCMSPCAEHETFREKYFHTTVVVVVVSRFLIASDCRRERSR